MSAPSVRARVAVVVALAALAWVGFALACFWLVNFAGWVVAMLLKAVS